MKQLFLTLCLTTLTLMGFGQFALWTNTCGGSTGTTSEPTEIEPMAMGGGGSCSFDCFNGGVAGTLTDFNSGGFDNFSFGYTSRQINSASQFQYTIDRTANTFNGWNLQISTNSGGINIFKHITSNHIGSQSFTENFSAMVLKDETFFVNIYPDNYQGNPNNCGGDFQQFKLIRAEIFGALLPVELVSFTAKSNNNNVDLEWVTATEINNDFFDLERSSNGKDFNSIARIKGTGTTSIEQRYSHSFVMIEAESYFRLKQVDFDGQFSYSNILFVSNNGGEVDAPLGIFVNANNELEWTITGTGNISLYNTLGNEIISTTWEATSDAANHSLDLNSLKSGVYYVQIIGENNIRETKTIFIR